LNKFIDLDVLARFRSTVGGVRIEDDIIILENGIENLTGIYMIFSNLFRLDTKKYE
jgi:hypothetical protein